MPSNTVWTGKVKHGSPYLKLMQPTDFRADMKQLGNSSSSEEDYREKMRKMMEKYTDAEVLDSLNTIPIASYFSTFGSSFDQFYGVQKAPSQYQQSFNALASAWALNQAHSAHLTQDKLNKLLQKVKDMKRTSGGVHIRNVQTGNLEFVS